jgi:hypothetical protein
MKRLLIAVAALVALGSFAAAQAAQTAAAKKVAICHKTSSKTRPYVRIVVKTNAALKAHLRHPDDIIPAGKTCPRTLLTPTSGGVAMTVNLLGVAEQPEPADAKGTGTATIRLRLGQGRVCFLFAVRGIKLPAAAAHIHRGAADASGPVVVTFTPPGASGASRGCVAASRTLVQQILRTPSAFYVNVHTTDFTGGAIRAQLSLPATIALLAAGMTGAAERPSPADPNGSGTAAFLILLDKAQVCFTLTAQNIRLPAVAAHIHRGGADQAGPVVVPLKPPDASGTSRGCQSADAGLLKEIAQTPGAFYANVHTTQFPGGAIRGQLSSAA